MIKVLHVVMGMNRGGLETFIMNIYRSIDRNIIQFDFLVHTSNACDYDEEIIQLGGNIYSVPSRRDGVIKNKIELDNFFKKHNDYSIVHQHASSLSYIEPLVAAKNNGIKVRIIHSHSSKQSGNKLNKLFHYLNRMRLYSFATHYFACSDFAAKWLYGKKVYKKGNFFIINNGVDINNFIYEKEVRERKRMELNFQKSTKIIGHVGQFSYPKNHDFLIDVYKKIYEKNNNSILLLVGDGIMRENIEKKIEAEGLQENVIILGVRTDIKDLLNAMDIFVFPSHYEGLPVTLVEAQATGLKCIVSDNITKQVKITNNIFYLKLSEGTNFWANKILQEIDYKRVDTSESITKNKFDIKSVVNDIQEFYLKC